MPTPAPAVSEVSPGDVAAWIALGLSVFGIVISVLLRYLDGPRARIRLRAVLLDVALGPTTTFTKGAWPIPTAEGQRPRELPAFGDVVEVAEIVVENVGRHPMTVYGVGFTWKGARPKWWRRRIRHTTVPRPLRPQQADEKKYSDGDKFRIEPADMVHLLVDYWGIVRRSRPNRRGVLKLRAHAEVAGRRHPRLSTRRLQWVIKDHQNTVVGGAARVPVRLVIARNVSLALLWTTEHSPMNVAYLARELEAHIGGNWPSEWKLQYELVKAFFDEKGEFHLAFYDDADGRMLQSTLAFGLVRDIEEWKDSIDWSDIRVSPKSVGVEDTNPPDASPRAPSPRRAHRDAGPPD